MLFCGSFAVFSHTGRDTVLILRLPANDSDNPLGDATSIDLSRYIMIVSNTRLLAHRKQNLHIGVTIFTSVTNDIIYYMTARPLQQL